MRVLSEPIAFDWDKGNIEKNLTKHKVINKEAEEVFSGEPLFVFKDESHSVNEKRYMLWGNENGEKRRRINRFKRRPLRRSAIYLTGAICK